MLQFGQKTDSKLRFGSGREACRYLLQNSRTADGRPFPVTATELVSRLEREGFLLNSNDAEALLHDIAADGEAMEIDHDAGYRWIDRAA